MKRVISIITNTIGSLNFEQRDPTSNQQYKEQSFLWYHFIYRGMYHGTRTLLYHSTSLRTQKSSNCCLAVSNKNRCQTIKSVKHKNCTYVNLLYNNKRAQLTTEMKLEIFNSNYKNIRILYFLPFPSYLHRMHHRHVVSIKYFSRVYNVFRNHTRPPCFSRHLATHIIYKHKLLTTVHKDVCYPCTTHGTKNISSWSRLFKSRLD